MDFARGAVTVLKRHSKNKREYSAPMNEVARAKLLALSEGAGDRPWVFVNPATGMSIGDIKKAFVGALADAKISDFRFHDLRHTFATRLADRGVPLPVIRDLLGQKSLKMARRYTHAVVETKAAAVGLPCAGAGRIVSTLSQQTRGGPPGPPLLSRKFLKRNQKGGSGGET